MGEIIEYLRQLRVPEPAQHWINNAVRHLKESAEPRSIMAAACCLREASRYVKHEDTRRWLQSLTAYLENRAFSS